MNHITFAQLNEAYHKGVYGQEKTLDIQEWVEALIDEGYDLDQYSDDELYEAYLAEVRGGGFIPQSGTTYSRSDYLSPAQQRRDKFKQIYGTDSGSKTIDQARSEAGIRSRYSRGSREEVPNRSGYGTARSPGGSDSGLSMSPKNRAELAARRAERGGNLKRANKIRSIMSRPPIAEDIYDLVSEYLISEGFCDSYEDADVIMANMSEEWREGIVEEVLEGVADQSDKQIDKGIATTYNATGVLVNQRSPALNHRVHYADKDDKIKRMKKRIENRRKDLFKEKDRREDENLKKLKKMLGL